MLEKILIEINKTEGVKGSMVVGKDGLLIASQLPSDVDAELVGAMLSAAYGAAEKACEEIKLGKIKQAMIEGEFGKALMIDIGDYILVVLTEDKVNLGLIRLIMKKAIDKIKAMI
ncbi:roadblock/LC7 domain-containing protein [Methanocaldococcus infernus]